MALETRVATARGDTAAQFSPQNKRNQPNIFVNKRVPTTAEGLGPIAVATVASLGDNDTRRSVVAGAGPWQS